MPEYFDGPIEPLRPDYFKDADRPRRADWKKHEKDIAERTGERQVPGSGNQPGSPGDTMGAQFIRDGKATSKKTVSGASITIREAWLRKIVREALSMGRTPVIEIRLEGATAPVPTDWSLLPSSDFQEILNEHL